jgi:ATP-dependent helicase/nuclease subunit A
VTELLSFPLLFADPSSPPDADARAQALDIRSSFIVEAPAGSGKTGLLIQRYLKLLADESVTSPEQVLAITFTNKATAELRERVLSQLELAKLDPPPTTLSEFDRETRILARAVMNRDRQLGWSLLDHPYRLHLRTIDSVCAEIARTLPILSGSGGRLTPAADADPLHREAARRTLLLLGTGNVPFDNALRDLLLHRDGNLAECESLLADMLSLRDQWGRLIPLAQHELEDAWLDANTLPRLELALDHAICAALTRLEKLFPPDLLGELTEIAADFGNSGTYEGDSSPLAICAGLRRSPQAVSSHLDHWRAMLHLLLTSANEWRKERGITGKNLRFDYDRKHPHHSRLARIIERVSGHDDLLEALCEVRTLPPAKYPAEQWAVAKSLLRVLSRALVELQFVFAERGECDFTELSLLARHALAQESSAEDLAAALGARLQHLLVDEMQDTSTSQYDLIERLTATWDGHSQTVFLVGDPRQSIYLFRQARVERFIYAMHTRRLGDLPLTRLRLTANFRSQGALVDQFNRDFDLIFPDSDPSGNPSGLPYTPAQPTLPASASSGGTAWHTHVLPARNRDAAAARTSAQNNQDQARKDAAKILRIARGWLAKPLPLGRSKPWSIAVLVRSRNHLSVIVSALRQHRSRIPFKAVEIEALNERQEILDLTALTRALLHPADRVAALAVLRAPWCGLSLADLYTLTGGDDGTLRHQSIARAMADRGHLLPDESCQRMTRVWNVLHAASEKRASLTTAQLVERAWLSLGGDAWLTPTQLANVRRFFQLLDQLEAAGIPIDPAVLSARLRCLYAEPDPIPAGVGYIELLTIHKAKGLEWDVVFVPSLEKRVAGNRSRLLTWSEIDASGSSADTAAHIMLAPISGRGEESQALNTWLNSIQSSREAAETKRLFYVACTRAREELHLFASPQLSTSGSLNPAAESLLKAAWAAAEPHFVTASTTSETWIPALESEEPRTSLPEPEGLNIAAVSSPSGPILQRLPSSFDPTARARQAQAVKLPYGEIDAPSNIIHAQFARPEGSFAARSFGNTIHACLDTLANRIVNGDTPAALLAELPGWNQRIAAMLRADGLPRPSVERLTREARGALEKILRDSDGLWLLSAHPRASSEYTITCLSSDQLNPLSAASRPATIRVDRVFEAGPEPRATGEDFLWIIDYKTTAPRASDFDAFLNAQRTTYAAQLETYARILGPARKKSSQQIRLALYYPTIPHLLWWQLTADIQPGF